MFWNCKIRSSLQAATAKSFGPQVKCVSCSTNIKSARRKKNKSVPELLWERSLSWAPDSCREKTFTCGQAKQPENTSNTCPAQHQEEDGREVEHRDVFWLHLSGAKFHTFRRNRNRFCSVSCWEKYHIPAWEKNVRPAVSPLWLLHSHVV